MVAIEIARALGRPWEADHLRYLSRDSLLVLARHVVPGFRDTLVHP
jgi:hypothetical protein